MQRGAHRTDWRLDAVNSRPDAPQESERFDHADGAVPTHADRACVVEKTTPAAAAGSSGGVSNAPTTTSDERGSPTVARRHGSCAQEPRCAFMQTTRPQIWKAG